MRDIIVGIDRSDTARAAARAAAELAGAYGANLHVVMCVERTKPVNINVGGDVFHTDWVTQAEEYLDSVVRTLSHDSITRSVGEGDPAKTLCAEADELDARAIVVGNRRTRGVARILGSVASDVIKSAPCDVLVANTQDDAG